MSNNSDIKNSPKTTQTLENLLKTVANLRQKSYILEDELSPLKAEQLTWAVERRRLARELEVKDDTINDLTRDLSLSKEAEIKAIKRYDKAMEYCREVEEKLEELTSKFDGEKAEISEKLRELIEKEEELEGFRGRNEVLVAKLEELGFRLREKEGEVSELEKAFDELKGNVMSRIDEVEEELSRRNEKIAELEKEKAGLEREKTELKMISEGRILRLEKEKAGLERKKTELEMIVEERILRLERDVEVYFCPSKRGDDQLACSQTGRILSRIISVLDGEQQRCVNVEGGVNKEVGLKEDPAFATHANDMTCSLATISEEAAKTTVISLEELSGVNGAACNPKSQSPACIHISDSDDDEISCHPSAVKRKRASSVSSIQKYTGVSSSEDSLNPKCKMKRLEHVIGEPAKHGQPIALSDCTNDHKFTTPLKQKVPAIRVCNEILSAKVKTPGSEGSDRNDSRSKKTDVLEYMARCQQKLQRNVLECVADIALACEKDAVFCAKAVCALYRNGLLSSRPRGFEKRDIDRATALAKRLVDKDSNYDKKSADELKKQDPGGLDVCRKLTREYSDKLLDIFKSNKDPLFSHLFTNVQYR